MAEKHVYVIAGLGNPGQKYAKTKHNMGFEVIDRLAERHGIKLTKIKHRALIGEGVIAGKRTLLVKPLTYMNLSGSAIRPIVTGKGVKLQNLIVVYDDVDVEPGKIRIRKKGSAGTHNGMKSVIACVKSEDFPRIRVGIGKSKTQDIADFVLSSFSQADKGLIETAIDDAACAVEIILKDGIDKAMNEYNIRERAEKAKTEGKTTESIKGNIKENVKETD